MSVMQDKATAVELKAELQIGSNRTAQTIVNKIKAMMFTKDITIINRRLTGKIELCIIRPEENIYSLCFFVAIERNNRKTGHIRIWKASEYSKECYRRFLLENIEPGSTIKRQSGHWRMVCPVEGYHIDTRNIENFEAPYAQNVYHNFIKNYQQQNFQEGTDRLSEFINHYNQYVNSHKTPASFDDILRNIIASKTQIAGTTSSYLYSTE